MALNTDEVVVVGLAVRGAAGIVTKNAFWESLHHSVPPVPCASTRAAPGPEMAHAAAPFDFRPFGVCTDALGLLPARSRFVLEAVCDALLDAYIPPRTLTCSPTALYVTAALDPPGLTAPGCPASPATMAESIAELWGLTVPPTTIDPRRDTGLDALSLARQALWAGSCELGIVVGWAGTEADPGRGHCAVAVLQCMSTAVARASASRVYAAVRSHSACGPPGDGETGAAAAVAHGLWTAAGIPLEDVAFVQVFGAARPPILEAAPPLSAARPETSQRYPPPPMVHRDPSLHLVPAVVAPILGLIKAALLVHHGVSEAVLKPLAVPMADRTSCVGLYAESLSGHRTLAVCVPAAAGSSPPPEEPPAPLVLVLSSHARSGLDTLDRAWHTAAARLPRALLPSACRTASALDTAQRHRRVYVAGPGAGLVDAEVVSGAVADTRAPPPVVFCFGGQGSGTPAMGRGLGAQFPVFRASLDRFIALYAELSGESLADVHGFGRRDLSDAAVASGAVAVPAITFAQCALVDLLRTFGVVPDACIGHSTGEIAAAYAARRLSAAEVVKICHAHVGAQAAMRPGAMMAYARAAGDAAADIAAAGQRDAVWVACVNGPAAVTLAGDVAALEALGACARTRDPPVLCKLLKGVPAYHSPHADAGAEVFRQRLVNGEGDEVQGPAADAGRCALVSAATGGVYAPGAGDAAAHWCAASLTGLVRFQEACEAVPAALGAAPAATVALEVSPQAILGHYLSENLPGVRYVPALRRQAPEGPAFLGALARLFVAGVPVDWGRVPRGVGDPSRCELHIPPLPWAAAEVTGADARSARELVVQGLREVLGLAAGADVDPTREFVHMGLDSVMGLQLSHWLSLRTGRQFPHGLHLRYPTVDALAPVVQPLCSRDGEVGASPGRQVACAGKPECEPFLSSSAPDNSDVVLIGSGGHTRSVLMALQAGGRRCTGIYTNLAAHVGREIVGVRVAGLLSDIPGDAVLHIALGDPALKRRFLSEFPGRQWATIIHPLARVHDSAVVGEGSFIGANAYVEPLSSVGAHTILTAGSFVAHDSKVGSFTLFGGNACTGGLAIVGDDCIIGTGAAVSPRTSVGNGSKLGSGSAAHFDIPAGCTAVGTPAQWVVAKTGDSSVNAAEPASPVSMQIATEALREVLGLTLGAPISGAENLEALGITSITSMVLSNSLYRRLGHAFSPSFPITHPTVNALARLIQPFCPKEAAFDAGSDVAISSAPEKGKEPECEPFLSSSAPDNSDVVLIGSGGHTRSVLMALQAGGRRCTGIYTNLAAHVGREIVGVRVAGLLSDIPGDAVLHIALGDPALKRRFLSEFPGRQWATIIHPLARVHDSAVVGEGSFIGANAYVEPLSSVGAHTILTAGSFVAHDSKVGSFTLFGGNACTGGLAIVGDDCIIGTGAAVSPRTSVGNGSKLGSGSAAHFDIPAGCTAVGTPAQWVVAKTGDSSVNAAEPASPVSMQIATEALREVLGLTLGAPISGAENLEALGITSITSMVLSNSLYRRLGHAFSPSFPITHPTVNALARLIQPFCPKEAAFDAGSDVAISSAPEKGKEPECEPFLSSSAPDNSDVVLIGSGGHTRSVLMALQAGGRRCTGIYTNLAAHVGREIVGVRVAGLLSDIPGDAVLHIALGDPALKRRFLSEFPGRQWATIIHPLARVHDSAVVGEGSFIGANAYVEPLSSVGAHTILTAGSFVAHDSKVGSFTLFGGNACTGGLAIVGDDCIIGTGAAVSPRTSVGNGSKLGSGSAAHFDIPAGCTAVGTPAQWS